jgi:hypothetical protein
MKRLVPYLLTLVGIFAASAAFGDSPEIKSVGPEEFVGVYGRLPHIATDSKSQPHIIVDLPGSSVNYFYDKIGSSWLTSSYNSGGSQSFNPHIEINDNDQAWMSIVKWYPQGMGMFVRDNMSTAPVIRKYSGTTGGTGGLPVSNLSIDPTINNKAVVYGGNGGKFDKVAWNGSSFYSEGTGTLDTGSGGEKNYFWVSRAGNVQHGRGGGGLFGNQAVWHSCSDWSYNNSLRKSNNKLPIHWANFAVYTGMGDDGAYPCIVGDSVEPQTAYMCMDLTQFSGQGLVMNIWKGTTDTGDGNLIFSKNGLLVVDPNGTSGLRRFEPQLYPCQSGGTWICYTVGGTIYVRHIPSDTTSAADLGPITQFTGVRGAICEDRDGNLHVVYSNGGIRYRKLEVTGSSRGVSVTDYDGDRKSDLVVYGINPAGDPNGGLWYIRKSGDGSYVTGRHWGNSNSVPIRADFNGDGVAEMVVFNNDTGMWYVSGNFGLSGTAYHFGDSNSIPAAADFDGDGSTDLAVYQKADHTGGVYTAGTWYIYSPVTSTGRVIVWGNADFKPAAADYDDDGIADPAAYNPTTGLWYINYSSATTARSPFTWGNVTAQFLVGDFTADGMQDLAAVVPGSTTKVWYTTDYTDMGNPNNTENFGTLASTAIAGDWDGDGVDDRASYESGTWSIKLSDAGTTWSPVFGAAWTAPLPQFNQ